MSSEWAIRVHNLSKTYRLYDHPGDRGRQWILPAVQKCLGRKPAQYYREVHAVENVSFEVKKGETLGIIGRNGSGKSTLLQLIVGTLSPTGGTIEIDGRVAALLELGAGFHPEFTGRENVFLNASLLGLSRADIDAQLDDMLAFADIGASIDQPVKTYSSGMVVRLAFAVMAHVKADILVIDEALAVGDAFFVQKCIRFLRAFMERGTVLFVSHDSAAVLSLCRKALWLEHGRIAGIGEAKTVCDGYLHEAYAVNRGEAGAEASEVSSASRSDAIQLRPPVISESKGEQGLQHAENVSGPEGRQARIEKIRFSDAVGRTVHTVSKRERVSLRIWCRTSIWMRSPIVGFLVRDRFGQSLFGANTCLVGQGVSDAVAPGSSFVAVLEFVMPVLHPGDYAMSVALADGTQQQHVQHHWMHDALAFTSAPTEPCFGLFAVELVQAGLRRTSTQDSRDERANDSVAL
ncbi:MAG: ABC transporter ATP-binding protein [Nitrospira sp.]|nr:ABC transporter ATP-binding protein [Nitrospira sp.]